MRVPTHARAALQYTSKNLLPAVAKRLDRVKAERLHVPDVEGVEDEDARVWAAQDALIERVPKVQMRAPGHVACPPLPAGCALQAPAQGAAGLVCVCVCAGCTGLWGF